MKIIVIKKPEEKTAMRKLRKKKERSEIYLIKDLKILNKVLRRNQIKVKRGQCYQQELVVFIFLLSK